MIDAFPPPFLCKSVLEKFETLRTPFAWEQDADLLRTTFLSSSGRGHP